MNDSYINNNNLFEGKEVEIYNIFGEINIATSKVRFFHVFICSFSQPLNLVHETSTVFFQLQLCEGPILWRDS